MQATKSVVFTQKQHFLMKNNIYNQQKVVVLQQISFLYFCFFDFKKGVCPELHDDAPSF